MTNTSRAQSSRPGSISRWILATLAVLFVAGAFGQFFLVGLGMFEDGSRWQDHKTFGSAVGLLTYVMWIPALIGKASRGVLLGTLLLFVLYMAQYAFINMENGVVNALHPLNGSVLLALGVWIAQRSISLAREPVVREARNPSLKSLSKEAT